MKSKIKITDILIMTIIFLILIILYLFYINFNINNRLQFLLKNIEKYQDKNENKTIKAICTLTNTTDPTIKGVIYLNEIDNDTVEIKAKIFNLPDGYHGIHIHKSGDLTEGCKSACEHYNPFNKNHGGPKDKIRHVGDLGNIYSKNGIATLNVKDKLIKLKGKYSVIGRSFVIHEDKDDLGKGGVNKKGKIINEKIYKESIENGNSGKRIACGVIGYSKDCN